MKGGRPAQYKTPEEMQRVIDLYFLICKVREEGCTELLEGLPEEDLETISEIPSNRPTVTGLAYALGLTRQGLINYQERDGFIDTVTRAKLRIELYLEERLYGKASAGVQFNLKNNYNWKDKQEIDMTAKHTVEGLSDEELDQRIKDISGGLTNGKQDG